LKWITDSKTVAVEKSVAKNTLANLKNFKANETLKLAALSFIAT